MNHKAIEDSNILADEAQLFAVTSDAKGAVEIVAYALVVLLFAAVKYAKKAGGRWDKAHLKKSIDILWDGDEKAAINSLGGQA